MLEIVVTTHEVVHSVFQGKQKGCVLKLDYEKAYDKVNWYFLLYILEKRGFWFCLDFLDTLNFAWRLCGSIHK